MKRFLLALLLALFVTVPVENAQDEESEAEWTFLLYWAGDNNLEFRTVQNLKSMMEFGSNEHVNLVVFADRNPADKDKRGFTNEAIGNIEDFEGAKIFYVKKDELEEIEDLEEVNDGDPAVLQHFVETAIAKYPAKKTALILRNHGGGFKGACYDDASKHDCLTLPEIRSVLAATAPAVGGKFELVGFDMCLCANLEVAHAVAPYAKYFSASEDLAYGSNYTLVMNRFMEDPSMNGAGLAKAYVDSYSEQHAKMAVATYSALDLSRIPALVKAVNEMAKVANEGLAEQGEEAWLKIVEIQSQSEEYGTSGGKSGGYHLFDIVQLATDLQAVFPETDVAACAGAVKKAAQAAILKAMHGADRPNAHGLSIYFPVESNKAAQTYAATPFAKENAWSTFLGTVTGTAAKDETPPEMAESQCDDNELDDKDSAKVSSSVKGKDVDEVFFVISVMGEKDEVIIGNLPVEPTDKGALELDWDGKWFTIGDAKSSFLCPVTDWEEVNDAQDTYLVQIPVQVRAGGKGEWIDVAMMFSVDMGKDGIKGKFESAWVDDGEMVSEFDLEKGDKIRPIYQRVNDDGEIEAVVMENPEDELTYNGPGTIVVGYERVPEGDYKLGFVATDYSGNYKDSYVAVKVK